MYSWDDFVDSHPRAADAVSKFRRAFLPPLNFITIHYTYFVLVCLISSVIFWGSSHPSGSVSYVDSLFLVVSAMTLAGLNTVNLSQINTWQQVLLWLLIIMGSQIFVSVATVLFRKRAFEHRFEDTVRRARNKRLARTKSMALLPPRLLRMVSFRSQPVSSPLAGLPGTGRLVAPGPPTPSLEGVPRLRMDGPRSEEDVSGGTLQESEPAESSSAKRKAEAEDQRAGMPPIQAGRIAFADSPHPNANANGMSSSRSVFLENQPERRTAVGRQGVADTAEATSDEKRPWDAAHLHFLSGRHAGRNGQFHGLTSEEREHLGGCEYRALKLLAVVVPAYFILWQFLGCVALGAWTSLNMPETTIANGIDPWWTGIFNGVSAFNNSGMSLLDANVIPFQNSAFVLITMGLMILAGNTAYPVFLRLILWSMLQIMELTTGEEHFGDWKATFRFILKYPRRVYTNLFPSRQTWWLVFMLILLNCIDWVGFELLNLGNPAIESISPGSRVLDGLFQALAVRSGGFYVVPISSVYIGLQVLYVIMMYISVYPVVITMRHSNVYEERSLGIYEDDSTADPDPETGSQPPPPAPAHAQRRSTALELTKGLKRTFAWHGVAATRSPGAADESRINFVSQQIRGQLAHDIWVLVAAVLVISTIETSNFLSDPVTYSVFNIIFEVVSAYGCVGISVGLPTVAYSFCGGWHAASKLVLCLVMVRGRHRGLPVALDRAVRLPGEQLHRDEDEDFRIRRSVTGGRRMSGEA